MPHEAQLPEALQQLKALNPCGRRFCNLVSLCQCYPEQ